MAHSVDDEVDSSVTVKTFNVVRSMKSNRGKVTNVGISKDMKWGSDSFVHYAHDQNPVDSVDASKFASDIPVDAHPPLFADPAPSAHPPSASNVISESIPIPHRGPRTYSNRRGTIPPSQRVSILRSARQRMTGNKVNDPHLRHRISVQFDKLIALIAEEDAAAAHSEYKEQSVSESGSGSGSGSGSDPVSVSDSVSESGSGSGTGLRLGSSGSRLHSISHSRSGHSHCAFNLEQSHSAIDGLDDDVSQSATESKEDSVQ